ncbi:MAG TPA: hypothetical protein PKA41_16070 [Verrucomicrobiota bacterium]|nr:hypothetical protein [Verrucomicrobiota bacterium]
MRLVSRLKVLALFVLASATFTPIANAEAVTFWFSGSVDSISNPSNALPSGINIGTPFAGRISYDPALVYSSISNTFPAGTVADYYYNNPTGLSVLVQIGGHTLTNAALVSQHTDGVHIYDNYNNTDEFIVEVGFNGLVAGETSYTNCFFVVHLRDNTRTAYTNAALPVVAPTLNQFATSRSFSWFLRNAQGAYIASAEGEITNLGADELIRLNIRQLDTGHAQLRWPVNVPGFTAQSTTNLAGGDWQNVTNTVTDSGTEHAVTVPTAGVPSYFRLKK